MWDPLLAQQAAVTVSGLQLKSKKGHGKGKDGNCLHRYCNVLCEPLQVVSLKMNVSWRHRHILYLWLTLCKQ